MTIARLRRILRRREYGCLSDRRLRLLLACQRLPNRIAHHHDLLVTLLVVLGAPADRPRLEVDIVPEQVPPCRDPPAGSFGHNERQRKQRMYARRHLVNGRILGIELSLDEVVTERGRAIAAQADSQVSMGRVQRVYRSTPRTSRSRAAGRR